MNAPQSETTSLDRLERHKRWYAAVHTDRLLGRADAALRLADQEQADLRHALERALDLVDVWETTDPDGLMSRKRAAAILREVLEP